MNKDPLDEIYPREPLDRPKLGLSWEIGGAMHYPDYLEPNVPTVSMPAHYKRAVIVEHSPVYPVVPDKQPATIWRKIIMSIIHTVLGCLLGCVFYLLLGLVTPVTSLGPWSTSILVGLCLVGVSIIGALPFWNRS